ncbi:MAG: DNA polymerase Y family protein [Phycisphaerae bacterium]|nr:DNA polymerase Y family protein [Phycisphaerae bacterium]
MRRAMSLWLPTWATDLVRHRLRPVEAAPAEGPARLPRGGGQRRSGLRSGGPRTAILLTQRQRGREVIARRCAVAAACGVGLGMDLAHARSLLPARVVAHVEEHRPQREAEDLRRLACWLVRYSPFVAVDSPDGVLLDATGLARLYPKAGESGLARAIGCELLRRGFAVRIAIAPTYGCAQAVVRGGSGPLLFVPTGGERAALAALPVEVLRLDAALHDALCEVGLTEIGRLLDVPRASLAAQFGEGLQRRLDRALGLLPETIETVRPEPPPRAELIFDGPTDRAESIEAATRDVLSELLLNVQSRGRCVRRLDLELRHPYGVRTARRVQLHRASRSIRHWWTMVRAALERVDLQAGVEGVALTATDITSIEERQGSFGDFGEQGESGFDDASWAETIDTLVSHFGADNVLRFEPVESHVPQRAFRAVSMSGPAAGEPVSRAALATSVTAAARPTRLFARPLRASVTLQAPDGPILQVCWNGRSQGVIACRGPERIGDEWWRRQCAAEEVRRLDQDYFAVQTEEGAWLWLVRIVATDRWFVQGDWA